MSVTKELTSIVKLYIENMGYEFIDLKYGKRGPNWFLQIFTDKEGGINIDDCTEISRQLSYELDRYPDLLKHAYLLEVSSPGLDRPLKTEKDFKRYVNEEINVVLADKRCSFEGKIVDSFNNILVLEDSDGRNREISLDNIIKAHLKVKI